MGILAIILFAIGLYTIGKNLTGYFVGRYKSIKKQPIAAPESSGTNWNAYDIPSCQRATCKPVIKVSKGVRSRTPRVFTVAQ